MLTSTPSSYTDTEKLLLHFDEAVSLEFSLVDITNKITPFLLNVMNEHSYITLPAEVSIKVSNDAEIQALNRDFREKDKATNVLSFPCDLEDQIPNEPYYLGDIIISAETLKKEAEEENKKVDHHFTHLLIHGLLHLLGYDHITDEEAEEMEALEIKLLAALNINNPYNRS